MSKEKVVILWFKRDLRLTDHESLFQSVKFAQKNNTKILPIYIFEPSLEKADDFHLRHWKWILNSLLELKEAIPISIFYKDAELLFIELLKKYDVLRVFSHMETGNDLTYERDKAIKVLFKRHKITWKEYQHNGVIRGIKNRNSWDKSWVYFMTRPIKEVSVSPSFFTQIEINEKVDHLFRKFKNINIEVPAGEKEAFVTLKKFLNEKVNDYFKNISFPEKSRYHTSRLSPYIAYGNISIRQIWQECQRAKPNIKNKMSINQYMARLKWHCHFIQKFETEPNLEFKNMNAAFNNIRNKKIKNISMPGKKAKLVILLSMRP